MTKRIFAAILASLLLSSLLAGGSTNPGSTNGQSTKASSGTQTEESQNTTGTNEEQASSSPDAPSEEEEDPLLSQRLLTIGSYDVSYGLYRYYYMSAKAQLEKDDPDHFADFDPESGLHEELNKMALEYCAEIAGYYDLIKELDLSYDDIDESFDNYVSYMTMMVGMYGMTLNEWFGGYCPLSVLKTFYEVDYAMHSVLINYLKDPENGYIQMSEDAVAALSENYRTVKHILVGYADGLSDEEALALAETLAERLRNGEDIDALMAEYSNDYHEGQDNAYTFTYGEMVKAFEEAAFSMEIGEVTDPVKSTYGYHVILRLPLPDDFVESHYPEYAAEKYLQDYGATLEIGYADLYEGLTESALA